MVRKDKQDALSASYLRGANLISRTTNTTEYYTFNAHGDVVNLTNASGVSVKTYDYDAFGNEKDRIGADPNPFRYCGEYFDVESGAYYLRARYYDPSVGRFTQEDTHWNASNMIYGDEPQQIGEYEDPLGTSRYVYAPQITAVMQAGNLYGYCVENPVRYTDTSGYSIKDDLRSLINEHPNIWSFRCDALGIVILLHYLYGKGETLELLDNQRIDNNTTIKDYMTSNQMLKRKVQEIVFPMGESLKPGETITIDITTAMEIDNGEDIIGYQYLHGTNEDVGGFQIKGTISKNELGDVTYDLTYIWNDIIDPNYQYASDAAKAKIAQMIPFAIPTDYIIRILWRDKTVIRAKPGLFKRNTGWLK